MCEGEFQYATQIRQMGKISELKQIIHTFSIFYEFKTSKFYFMNEKNLYTI